MALTAASLLVRIGSDISGLDKGLNDADRKVSSFGSKIGKVAGIATAAIGVGLVAGLTKAVSSAATFEHAVDQVGAVAQATNEQMKGLSATALRIGKDTAFGATEVAQAMEILAANGISAEEIMNGAADAAVNLAAAGGTTLAVGADVASTAMSVWNLKTSEMADVVNRVAAAANVSRFGVEDMSKAIAAGGGVAAAGGVEFGDFAAAIAATADKFASGQDAGTGFKTFMNGLVPSTKEAKSAMRELGLMTEQGTSAFYDANGSLKSMAEIAGLLNTALSGLTEAKRTDIVTTIFGTDAQRTALGLAQMTREEFQALQNTMRDTSAADLAKQRMDNFNGSLEQLMGSLETLAISVGMVLLPALRNVADAGAKALDWLMEQDWSGVEAALSTVSNAIQGIAETAMTLVSGGNIAELAVRLEEAFGIDITPFITTLADVRDGIQRVKDWMQEAIDTFNETKDSVLPQLGGAFDALGPKLLETIGLVGQIIGKLIEFQAAVGGAVGSTNDMNASNTEGASRWQALIDVVGGFLDLLNGLLKLIIPVVDWLTQQAVVVDTVAASFKNLIDQMFPGLGVLQTLLDLLPKITQAWEDLKASVSTVKMPDIQLPNIDLGKLRQQGVDAANALVGGYTSPAGMDQNSPSKTMQRLAEDSVAGLLVGIDKMKPEAATATRELAQTMQEEFLTSATAWAQTWTLQSGVAKNMQQTFADIAAAATAVDWATDDTSEAITNLVAHIASGNGVTAEWVNLVRAAKDELGLMPFEVAAITDAYTDMLEAQKKIADDASMKNLALGARHFAADFINVAVPAGQAWESTIQSIVEKTHMLEQGTTPVSAALHALWASFNAGGPVTATTIGLIEAARIELGLTSLEVTKLWDAFNAPAAAKAAKGIDLSLQNISLALANNRTVLPKQAEQWYGLAQAIQKAADAAGDKMSPALAKLWGQIQQGVPLNTQMINLLMQTREETGLTVWQIQALADSWNDVSTAAWKAANEVSGAVKQMREDAAKAAEEAKKAAYDLANKSYVDWTSGKSGGSTGGSSGSANGGMNNPQDMAYRNLDTLWGAVFAKANAFGLGGDLLAYRQQNPWADAGTALTHLASVDQGRRSAAMGVGAKPVGGGVTVIVQGNVYHENELTEAVRQGLIQTARENGGSLF